MPITDTSHRAGHIDPEVKAGAGNQGDSGNQGHAETEGSAQAQDAATQRAPRTQGAQTPNAANASGTGQAEDSGGRLRQSRPGDRVGLIATLLAVPFILIAIAAFRIGDRLLGSATNGRLAPTAFVIGAFFLLAGFVLPVLTVRESRLEKEARDDCTTDCDDLKAALRGIGDKTLQGLALVNFRQLRTFTVIAQRQARMSYYASLAAAAASLLVLIAGAATALGLPTTTAKVAAGTLTAGGATLSGILTKVFLRTYQMASHQMSYYYGQPLVHCYLLHAEWLTHESRRWQDKGVQPHLIEKVIDSSIQASFNAETHLLSLQGLGRIPGGPEPAGEQGTTGPRKAGNPGRRVRRPLSRARP